MRIIDIFTSIDGECNGFHQGRVSTFIRLVGCNLKCPYCDTKESQNKQNGKEYSVDEIINKIEKIGIRKITITGGEPGLQSNEVSELIKSLSDKYIISIELNGTRFIEKDKRTSLIVDYKLSSSGYEFSINNFRLMWEKTLDEKDFIKFCIFDEKDYKKAISVYNEISKEFKCQFAFSLINPLNNDFDMINDLIKRKMDVIFNLQIHKFLNVK